MLLAFTFPLSELFSAQPLAYVDSPFHQYQVNLAKELWESRNLVGYDPWFAAGHIGGVNYNASAKIPALLAALFPSLLEPAVAYKLYVFLCGLLAPGFVLLAMLSLKADTITTVAVMVLGCLMWWISSLRWYHTVGMVSFVAASYASLPYIMLTWRTITTALKPFAIVILGLSGAAGLLLHPLFPVPVIFASLFLALSTWNKIQLKSLVCVLAIVPLLSVLPNLFWILPSIHYSGWSDGSLSPFQKTVDINIIFSEALGRIEGAARGARINLFIWFCVIWAVIYPPNPLYRRIVLGFVFAALALIIFAAISAISPTLGTLQPNRQSAAAYLLLIVPAGIGIASILRAAAKSGLASAGTKISLVLVLSAFIFLGLELKNELSAASTPHYGRPSPEVRGPGELTSWIADWLKQNTTANARILFETSSGRITDGAHAAGYLARVSDREFIGEPYVYMHHAGFWDGHLFGQSINRFSAETFSEQLDLYNVGWIVAHSPASQAYLESHPDIQEQARHGAVAIYKVKREHNYFLEGSGKVVQRKTNRIDLDELSGAAIILKYHYADGLITEPSADMEPVMLSNDPQPFIRLLVPPRRLSIIFP